jgi:hypothetical protein
LIWRVVQQLAQAETIDAGVVGNGGQVLHARITQGGDQRLGDAAQAKAADRNGLAVLDDVFQRGGRVWIHFVHESPFGSCLASRVASGPADMPASTGMRKALAQRAARRAQFGSK